MGLEEQLCLLLARRSSDEAEQKTRQLLAAPLAWDRFLEVVRAQEILPLVYCNLKRLEFAGVPQDVQQELAKLFRANALRNTLLAEELLRVLALLAEAHVQAIPLKGIPLAESLYHDSALRVCADIDILVPPLQFVAAFQILRAAGYESGFSQLHLAKLIARFGKDCGLMRQNGAHWYPLQLHAGLLWGGPMEKAIAEEIWSEAQPTTFHNAPGFSFSPEWQFLYLAIHAARHGLSPWKFLVDIDRLCGDATISWEAVREKAVRLGWEAPVDSVLAACSDLFGTTIPAALIREASNRESSLPATLAETDHSGLRILREMRFSIGLLRSPWKKLQYAATRIFIPTPADTRSLSLPGSLFFLYYAWRPLRLAFTVAGWLVEAARQDRRSRSTNPDGAIQAN